MPVSPYELSGLADGRSGPRRSPPPWLATPAIASLATDGRVAPSGCVVNVVLDQGAVRAATFVGPSGVLLRENPSCSAVVHGCIGR
jgi:hypothetical protein